MQRSNLWGEEDLSRAGFSMGLSGKDSTSMAKFYHKDNKDNPK